MDGLSLNDLNVSTMEHSSYTQAFRELAEHSHQDHPGDYHARIPEVRCWLRDQFCTLSLGQIDQVSSRTGHYKVIRVVDTQAFDRSYG